MANTISRGEMEAIIRQGGSVLYRGQFLTRVEHLPSEAELAQGDPVQEAAATAAIDQQIAALLAQREQLSGGQAQLQERQLAPGEKLEAGTLPPGSTARLVDDPSLDPATQGIEQPAVSDKPLTAAERKRLAEEQKRQQQDADKD